MRLNITGGYAGVRRSIDVAPDGEVDIGEDLQTDGARPLSGADVRALGSLLAEVDFGKLPERSVSESLRDGFHYRLAYDGHTLVTDKTRRLGPVDDVIDFLEKALQDRKA